MPDNISKFAIRAFAFILMFFLFLESYSYPLVLSLVLALFVSYCMLAVVSPSIRRSRFTPPLKRIGMVAAVLAGILWLASITVYARLPYGRANAWAIGGGCFRIESGVSFSGTPLTTTLRWAWSGATAGGFGTATAFWKAGKVANSRYRSVWPVLLILSLPTVILFLIDERRYPAGVCQNCGYDLRASKERCPECGEEFGSTNVGRSQT